METLCGHAVHKAHYHEDALPRRAIYLATVQQTLSTLIKAAGSRIGKTGGAWHIHAVLPFFCAAGLPRRFQGGLSVQGRMQPLPYSTIDYEAPTVGDSMALMSRIRGKRAL